ncbi:hypothetical protein [Streptomyces fumanus]|uniref:Uncharacterized protein n=1 Tax=Streptomyces fumanus TaxID=67302 RepID=A0A919ACB7_9ACTN|nr:hypothetical protein [Streptomyces fumanus]GHE99610.1 hypothetical protein GCM10018772_25040 [Streptomyces fumanus]
MTTPPAPDGTPLFDVDVPMPRPPVEQLLALAGLYTRHNDRIDLLLSCLAPADPDAYVSSAPLLEHRSLACVRTVRQQRPPRIEPVLSAVVRLQQIAYLTSSATRYLASAQQAAPPDLAPGAPPDPRRAFGRSVRLSRELTALAAPAIVESATHIAGRLPAAARARTTVPGTDRAQRDALLHVARGHVVVTGRYERTSHDRTVAAGTDVLRHLDAQGLVDRDPDSAFPSTPRGTPHDRVRLTPLGLAVLSTLIVTPLPTPVPAPRPVASPAPATRARR